MASGTPFYLYNDAAFRTQFPAFADANSYPAQTLQAYFDTAGLYVVNSSFGYLARSGATLHSLNLLTAHLAQLSTQIMNGEGSGIEVQASIDKISVTLQQIELPNQWAYWLNSTEYGKQLYALLQVKSVGGFYIPGGLGRAGLRC